MSSISSGSCWRATTEPAGLHGPGLPGPASQPAGYLVSVIGRATWSRRSAALPGLGDLRAALERVRRVLDAFRGHLLLQRRPRLLGQPDLEQVPGRRRMLAAHHDHVREYLLELPGQLGAAGRRAADHAAQEPAGPVHAEESDRLLLGAMAGFRGDDARMQFRAERPFGLFAVAARLRDLGGDLLPYLVPEPAGFRRGERLQLQAVLAAQDRDPHALVLGHVDLDLQALADWYLEAAEVHPLPSGKALSGVPGTRCLPARVIGGCRACPAAAVREVLVVSEIFAVPGSLVSEVIVGEILVLRQIVGEVLAVLDVKVIQGSVSFESGLSRVLAAAPSEHPARSLPCRSLPAAAGCSLLVAVAGYVVAGCLVAGCLVAGYLVAGCLVAGCLVAGYLVAGFSWLAAWPAVAA